MANRFKLTLSDKDAKAKMLGVEIDVRVVELQMLENLFYIAANNTKSAKEIHLCLDFADQIKNICDKTEIILDDTDKANLEKGIAETEKNRPMQWYVSPLWRQFDKLEPMKE